MGTQSRGASCTTCRHLQRAEIESALASGNFSLRAVARHFEMDAETLRRHAQRHLAPALREALSGTPGFSAGDIAARVLAAAESALQIRVDAAASGQDAIALRAIDTEVRTLSIVADRLGLDIADASAELEASFDLRIAVGRAAQKSDVVASAVAAELRQLDRDDFADDLLTLAPNALIEK